MLLTLIVAADLVAAEKKSTDPLDWPHWRGPEQNGISRETGLIDTFDPATGENVLWKNDKLGTISTPIIMNGKLYVLCRSEPGTTREGEKVVCADAATGEILWENIFNVYLSDVPDTRVAWSNVAGDPETGHVYALGVCDYFQCIDGETGKTIWSRSLSEEFGMLSTYGGRTNTPIVFEDLVIISGVCTNWGPTSKPGEPRKMGPADLYLSFDEKTGGRMEMATPAHRFLAFDKRTGTMVWFNGTEIRPKDTTYSTPILAVIEGQTADDLRLRRRQRLRHAAAHRQDPLEVSTWLARASTTRRWSWAIACSTARAKRTATMRWAPWRPSMPRRPATSPRRASCGGSRSTWSAVRSPSWSTTACTLRTNRARCTSSIPRPASRLPSAARSCWARSSAPARCMPTARSTCARPAPGTSSSRQPTA